MVYLTKLPMSQMHRQRKMITEYSVIKDIWWNDRGLFWGWPTLRQFDWTDWG